MTRALVVGGSSAIGGAIAADLAAPGADVVLRGRDPTRLRAATRRCDERASADVVDVTDRPAISPGPVAAGAGLCSSAGQERPPELLRPTAVAAAVRFVEDVPATGCPVEIELQQQRTP